MGAARCPLSSMWKGCSRMVTLARQIDHALEVRRAFGSGRSSFSPGSESRSEQMRTDQATESDGCEEPAASDPGTYWALRNAHVDARLESSSISARRPRRPSTSRLSPRRGAPAISPARSGVVSELTGDSADTPDNAEIPWVVSRPAPPLAALPTDREEALLKKKSLQDRPVRRRRRGSVLLGAVEVFLAALLTAVSAAAVSDAVMIGDLLVGGVGTLWLVILICAALLLVTRAVAFVARMVRKDSAKQAVQRDRLTDELEERVARTMTSQLNTLRDEMRGRLGPLEDSGKQLVGIREDIAAMNADITAELREVSRPLIGLRGR